MLFLFSFYAFSQAMKVEIENGLLRCDQHLELQVLSTHMPYFGEKKFRPQIGAIAIKIAQIGNLNDPKLGF